MSTDRRPSIDLPTAPQVLWSIAFGGGHTAPAGHRYFFDNRERGGSLWVVQASLTGSIDISIDGQTYPAPAGSIVLFRHGEDSQYGHREPLVTPYRNRWVALRGAGVDEHLRQLRDTAGPVLDLGLDHPLHEALDELVGFIKPDRSVAATRQAATIHQFVMAMIEHVTSTRRHEQAPVEQAVDHLVERPLEPIDTQAVADRFGVSREHLCRVFRQRTGGSPARYLDRRRVDHAVALLGATDLPLEDIAQQSGLRSARHLADRVRARFGRPPSALRRRT